MSKLIVAGMMPNENWFTANRMVYDPNGIAPAQLARPGGWHKCLDNKFSLQYFGDRV